LSNRRVYRRTIEDKTAHADVQEDVSETFVSHNGGIIALNHLMAYNLITPFWGNFILISEDYPFGSSFGKVPRQD